MAGTLENYSVSCELTFLLREIESWIFFSISAPFLPTLCSEYSHPGPHPLHASKAESSASCPQHGNARGPRLIWGNSEESFKSLGSHGEWLGWPEVGAEKSAPGSTLRCFLPLELDGPQPS